MEIFGFFFGISLLLDIAIMINMILSFSFRVKNAELALTLLTANYWLLAALAAFATFMVFGFGSSDIYDDLFSLIPLAIGLMFTGINLMFKIKPEK